MEGQVEQIDKNRNLRFQIGISSFEGIENMSKKEQAVLMATVELPCVGNEIYECVP